MNKPIFVDTSHLTEAQKCILALEQAFSQGHGEYRVQELKERLMKLSTFVLLPIPVQNDFGLPRPHIFCFGASYITFTRNRAFSGCRFEAINDTHTTL